MKTKLDRKQYKHAWYVAHRDVTLARAAEWYAAHRDKVRAQQRGYRAAHHQEIKAQRAKRYASNREQALASVAAYYRSPLGQLKHYRAHIRRRIAVNTLKLEVLLRG